MAQLTAANAASYGHQGARGHMAFYAGARPDPVLLGHCFYMDNARGYPSEYFSVVGTRHTAAAESEGAAATTPSALNTPTGSTLTPAGFLISLAVNSQARRRTLAENDPVAIMEEEIKWGCGVYLMDDATVGLGQVFTTVTANDGDTGATLTLDGILDVGDTIRSNLDDATLGVTLGIDGKGAADVQRDIITNASSYLGNPAISKFIAGFIDQQGMKMDLDDGFWMTPDGRTAVYVEPGYSMLVQSAGDRIGCGFISPTEKIRGRGIQLSRIQTGKRRISPAFAICVDEDPCSAAKEAMVKYTEIATPSGIVVLSLDANTGYNYLVQRGRGNATVALVNDNSACECRYLA